MTGANQFHQTHHSLNGASVYSMYSRVASQLLNRVVVRWVASGWVSCLVSGTSRTAHY
jgi:hypothetical protein